MNIQKIVHDILEVVDTIKDTKNERVISLYKIITDVYTKGKESGYRDGVETCKKALENIHIAKDKS
jgi:hypothetical protein